MGWPAPHISAWIAPSNELLNKIRSNGLSKFRWPTGGVIALRRLTIANGPRIAESRRDLGGKALCEGSSQAD